MRHTEPEIEPWLRPDTQANRIASADYGEVHPALCFEFGDPNGDPFIPDDVLKAVVNIHRFVAAVWQQDAITTIDMSRTPGENNKNGWCDVTKYALKLRNPIYKSTHELEPRDIVPELMNMLCTPLGYPISDIGQVILTDASPVHRVIFEFPDSVEKMPLPLDTSIAALGALAHKDYQSTVYGSDTV